MLFTKVTIDLDGGTWVMYFTGGCSYLLCELKDHDDVIKLIHFPRDWPFVRGIHR